MENEIWMCINGFDEYMVSNFGRVKSVERKRRRADGRMGHKKEKILNPVTQSQGYLQVQLTSNEGVRKQKLVHRLVMEAFHPEMMTVDTSISVDHLDGDKRNNSIANLEVVPHRVNVSRYWSEKKSSGLPVGVSMSRGGRFVSSAKVKNKQTYLGTYDTSDEASDAYLKFIERVKAEPSTSASCSTAWCG